MGGMSSLIAVPVYNRLGALVPNYFVFAAALIALVMLPFAVFLPIFARFSTSCRHGGRRELSSQQSRGMRIPAGVHRL